MGWEIHRIWSTSWFQDETTELDRAVKAIEEQRRRRDAEGEPQELEKQPADSWEARPSADDDWAAAEDHDIEASEPAEADEQYGIRCPLYERAVLRLPALAGELHEQPPGRIAAWLAEVVEAEAPVHIEIASRRVANELGVLRRGSRIRRAFELAAKVATRTFGVVQRGEFLYSAARAQFEPRDRSLLDAWEKSIAMVAPEEIDAAIRTALLASHGAPAEDAAVHAARLLGLGRTGKDIRTAIDSRLDALQRAGQIRENRGYLEWNDDLDASRTVQ